MIHLLSSRDIISSNSTPICGIAKNLVLATMGSDNTMNSKTSSFTVWLNKFQKFTFRPWYLPAVCLLAALDVFVWVIPTDLLLISFVLLRPNKWVSAFIWVSLGSALGALSLGFIFHYFSDFALAHFSFMEGWDRTVQWIEEYGAPAVGLCAAGPAPIVVCAGIAGFMKVPLLMIFLASWAGRLLKYSVFSFLASYVPHVFNKKYDKGLNGDTPSV